MQIDQNQTIAGAVGIAAILAGFYGFKRTQLSTIVRVALGIAMLLAGVVLLYPLMQAGDPWSHPVRCGLAIALLGLGINQAATPLRLALGKPA